MLFTTLYGVAVPIRYTPGQLRDALGLTKETFRYWKRDLPALGSGRDQRPRFGPSDLLATAIVKRLTEVAGVPVSRLAPISDHLFALCRASAWPQLERMVAVFLLETDEVRFDPNEASHPISCVAFVLPLRPVVNALREHLHEAEFEVQANLAFPPFALSQGVRR